MELELDCDRCGKNTTNWTAVSEGTPAAENLDIDAPADVCDSCMSECGVPGY